MLTPVGAWRASAAWTGANLRLTQRGCRDPLTCHEMGVLAFKQALWSQAEGWFLEALNSPAAQTSAGAVRLAVQLALSRILCSNQQGQSDSHSVKLTIVAEASVQGTPHRYRWLLRHDRWHAAHRPAHLPELTALEQHAAAWLASSLLCNS